MISYDEINNLGSQDLLINCTPCGMHPNIDESPVKKEDMENFNIAIDTIYNPKETLFLKNAKKLGLTNINGLFMLVGQAIKAQELWNDLTIDEKIISDIYNRVLKLI
ncbi:shikimate dehydrogenase [Haloplasma contractile]|uniref:Shikimate dehydrogenase protein n=1 Tax=Haloplasma contractile SSD-17B TaxID=1033810 RepID=U2FK97_9MOLU|nr:shikimate dehydrogenase [Haloplasma contractile]ERJ11659.1 Shikimate dehydrogenase protein [Haloplasma contractile SSD-17B]